MLSNIAGASTFADTPTTSKGSHHLNKFHGFPIQYPNCQNIQFLFVFLAYLVCRRTSLSRIYPIKKKRTTKGSELVEKQAITPLQNRKIEPAYIFIKQRISTALFHILRLIGLSISYLTFNWVLVIHFIWLFLSSCRLKNVQ